MNGRLGRLLDVISGRPQDVRLGRPTDFRLGCPRDGQIGPLGDVLGTLEGDVLGTSWGPIFAGWVGNKIADKITSVGKPRSKKKKEDEMNVMEETQEIYIPPEKRKQIIKDWKLF